MYHVAMLKCHASQAENIRFEKVEGTGAYPRERDDVRSEIEYVIGDCTSGLATGPSPLRPITYGPLSSRLESLGGSNQLLSAVWPGLAFVCSHSTFPAT